jgi:hypothetical protein
MQQKLDFGVTKSDLEPLIDHWLEKYDWRAQESLYNDNLPQFHVPVNETRVHFATNVRHLPQQHHFCSSMAGRRVS